MRVHQNWLRAPSSPGAGQFSRGTAPRSARNGVNSVGSDRSVASPIGGASRRSGTLAASAHARRARGTKGSPTNFGTNAPEEETSSPSQMLVPSGNAHGAFVCELRAKRSRFAPLSRHGACSDAPTGIEKSCVSFVPVRASAKPASTCDGVITHDTALVASPSSPDRCIGGLSPRFGFVPAHRMAAKISMPRATPRSEPKNLFATANTPMRRSHTPNTSNPMPTRKDTPTI